ncbi:hypothetical protein PG997_014763 [Apiospora hydei]|uniref:DUF7025 domain-containing protein n=1 Tax=Apiospora hydei TaxID=1337664 RepID=A0ABR1UUR2_9PEZI
MPKNDEAGDPVTQDVPGSSGASKEDPEHSSPPLETPKEPWFSEVARNFGIGDSVMPVVQDDDAEINIAPKGMKPKPMFLYEGPLRCPCCPNWVKEYPNDVKEVVETTNVVQQHAVVIRKKKAHKKNPHKPLEIHSIVIYSSLIREALKQHVFDGYAGVNLEVEDLVFEAPFREFFHRWEKLNDCITNGEDPRTVAHLNVLHEILQPEVEEQLNLSKSLVKKGLITFDLLWSLFKPGECIYAPATQGWPERLMLLETAKYDEDWQKKPFYRLNYKFIEWDGRRLGFNKELRRIYGFEGPERITELPVYPLSYHGTIDAVKDRCYQRGRRFEQLAGLHYVAYRGTAYRRLQFMMVLDHDSETLLDERVMIDAKSYYREGSDKL